jgi:membrane protease YdiL (CAAX protease family)
VTTPTAVRSNRTGITVFLLLSFGLTWGTEVVVWGMGYSLANPLVQLSFAFFPAIAAIVVRAWVTREGFADAGMRLRVRGAWPYYLGAWLGPWVLAMATLGLAAALGLCRVDLSRIGEIVSGVPIPVLVLMLLVIVPLLAPLYWGEEFGWTSYLRMRLMPERPVVSTVLTGLIWAVWHWPLAFLGYIEFSNTALGLTVWTLSFLVQEILLSFLWLRSRTIWTASVAHAGNNLVLALITGKVLSVGEGGPLNDILVTTVGTIPMAALALWAILAGRLALKPDDDSPAPVVLANRVSA